MKGVIKWSSKKSSIFAQSGNKDEFSNEPVTRRCKSAPKRFKLSLARPSLLQRGHEIYNKVNFAVKTSMEKRSKSQINTKLRKLN